MMKTSRMSALASVGAGFALVAASVVVGSAVADTGDPASGVSEAGVASGSATMKEQCTWFITGVQTAVTMSAGEEYDGSSLEMSATPGALSVFYSGNENSGTIDAHSACTWFGADNADGIAVSMSADGGSFTAAADVGGADTDMNFTTGLEAEGNAFVIGLTDGNTSCRSNNNTENNWAVANLNVEGAAASADVMALTAANTTGVPSDTAGNNDACTSATSYAVTIPANKQPTYPGQAYTFTGPQVTTAVTIETNP